MMGTTVGAVGCLWLPSGEAFTYLATTKKASKTETKGLEDLFLDGLKDLYYGHSCYGHCDDGTGLLERCFWPAPGLRQSQ
jgi:hypothetical protein